MIVEETITLLAHPCNVDRGDMEFVLVDPKISAGLLSIGFDLSEHNTFRTVVPNDNLPEKLPVSFVVETAKMGLQIGIEVVDFDVLTCKNLLIAKDRGEGL